MIDNKHYYYAITSLCLFVLFYVYVDSLLNYDPILGSSYNTFPIIYKYLLKSSYMFIHYFLLHSFALLNSDYDEYKDKLDVVFFVFMIVTEVRSYYLALYPVTTQYLNIDFPF